MVDVKKLYPYFKEGCGVCDYTPIVEAFGNVAVRVDDDGYQGDTWVLYDNDGKIGYLIFGWGSCTYCDALQGCDTIEEVQELCNKLENDIRWFDTAEEALKWFNKYDWEGDWSWHCDEGKLFVREAIGYLGTIKDD